MAPVTALAMCTFISHGLLVSSIQLRQLDDDPIVPLTKADDSENGTLDSVLEEDASEGPACGRGRMCGLKNGETPSEPMSVNCPNGKKWFTRNAIMIRGNNGKNAIYCSVPKVGTSYTFGVLSDLHLPVRGGKRNAGYEAVHELISQNTSKSNEEVCNAYSFMMVRNPWERIASAYVDKVLTKEVFSTPPSFNKFMHMLLAEKEPEKINQHFRPASLTCQTHGDHAMKFDKTIKIESNPRKQLEQIFVNKLDLSKAKVTKVLDVWEKNTHSTLSKGWAEIDKSMSSDLSRVNFYFSQTDPSIVNKVYKDDVAFGGYRYR